MQSTFFAKTPALYLGVADELTPRTKVKVALQPILGALSPCTKSRFFAGKKSRSGFDPATAVYGGQSSPTAPPFEMVNVSG